MERRKSIKEEDELEINPKFELLDFNQIQDTEDYLTGE